MLIWVSMGRSLERGRWGSFGTGRGALSSRQSRWVNVRNEARGIEREGGREREAGTRPEAVSYSRGGFSIGSETQETNEVR
jgi:hypothetical protein